MRTDQEIFDTVAMHLITQGKPSFGILPNDHMSGCLYRGPDSTKCAGGVLIPDNVYRPEIEGCSSYTAFCWLGLKELEPHQHLISALQRVHDNPNNWVNENPHEGFNLSRLKQHLTAVAKFRGLSSSEVLQ